MEADAAIGLVTVARQLFQSVFVRNEVYHFMESGSKIGKLRQQGDQQIARGIAALAGPAQFHRRAVVRPFTGQVVRHEFMRLALPQRFVQPLGLLPLSQAISTRLPARKLLAATAQATASWALSAPDGSALSSK